MSLQTNTFTGVRLEPFLQPEDAMSDSVPFGPSLTIVRGTILGIKTADSKFYAYASGNVDGTQVPKAIAMCDFTTDASGNALIAGETNATYNTAPIWVAGTFRTTELVGFDANALAVLFARLTSGTVADGVVRLG